MKKLWQKIGAAVFWISWPISYVYLRGSERTRVLLVSGDHILLVQGWHSTGKWSLPGGGLRAGEVREHGALRELQEEIGLTLTASQLQPLVSSMYHNHGLSCMCHYFIVMMPEQVAVQVRFPEIIDAKWLNYLTADPTSWGVDVQTALEAWKSRSLLQ